MSQSSLDHKDQAWSALFQQPMSDLLMHYNASVQFDQRLAKVDIQASLAHAQMLARQNIISQEDFSAIEHGMQDILKDIENHQFDWSIALEDVHLNIEARLTQKIGDAGKRLHTARSRNDQVATDIRLWLREHIDVIDAHLLALIKTLLALAKRHATTIMPGFTHLQVAQPIAFGHHLLAYVEMLHRDRARLADCRSRVNVLPLGSAALAGTSYPVDRAWVAEKLGFSGLCHNSLDAVSDRDFAIEFCAFAAICMMHLSRFCEECILWSNPAFGFIAFSDSFCTGSSIMPQKKNPDVAELARGKTARVYGHLMALLTLMKAQPLAYNKDNQEDKEPLFDTVDTLSQTLRIFNAMLQELQVFPNNMRQALQRGHATATDLADYLVRRGLAFRDAHEAVAMVVHAATAQGVDTSTLTYQAVIDALPEKWQSYIAPDCEAALTLENSLHTRAHIGGTAPACVLAEIDRLEKLLNI